MTLPYSSHASAARQAWCRNTGRHGGAALGYGTHYEWKNVRSGRRPHGFTNRRGRHATYIAAHVLNGRDHDFILVSTGK